MATDKQADPAPAEDAPAVAEPAEVLADSLERLADGHLANHVGALRVIVAARMIRDHARIVAEKDDDIAGLRSIVTIEKDGRIAAEQRAEALAGVLPKWLDRYNTMIRVDLTCEAEQVLRCINEAKALLTGQATPEGAS